MGLLALSPSLTVDTWVSRHEMHVLFPECHAFFLALTSIESVFLCVCAHVGEPGGAAEAEASGGAVCAAAGYRRRG